MENVTPKVSKTLKNSLGLSRRRLATTVSTPELHKKCTVVIETPRNVSNGNDNIKKSH